MFLCTCTMIGTLCLQPIQLKKVQAKSIYTDGNKAYDETTKVNLKKLNLSLVNGKPKIKKK